MKIQDKIAKAKMKLNKAQTAYDKENLKIQTESASGKLSAEKELKLRTKLLKTKSKLIEAQSDLKNLEIELERYK